MNVLLRIFVFALCLGVFLFPVFGEEPDGLDRALGQAIDTGNISAAISLLKAGANPNGIYKEEYGTTFLMRALDRHENQMAELLLDYGADPDVRNNYGRSAVYAGGYYVNNEGVALLVSRGARFDIIDREKKSPLMYHIEKNRGSPAATLILQWEETHTPGFTAGYDTRRDYLSALLPPFFRRDLEYDDDDTSLKLAARLLSLGADPAVWDSRGIHVFHHISSGYHYRREMLALFFDHGAPLNSVGRYDQTLLMRAAESSRKDGVEVGFLLGRGEDPNFQNKKGETALMHAKTIAAAKLLLAHGAQLDVQDNDGETALMHAWLYPEVQKVLLDAGADPSITDNRGRNVLFNAFTSSRRALDTDLIDGFLAGGCDINAYSTRGYTPIMSAADSYDSAFVLALLERGADPLLLDNNGKTVLQIYLESRESSSREKRALEMEVITALLEAGVPPAALDTKGNSALFYVMRKRDSELKPIQNLLLKYSSDDDKKTASALVATEKRNDTRETLSAESASLAWGISLPLVVGGISIFMREGVYAKNKSANAWGSVNSVLTLGTAGFFLGAFIGGGNYSGSGSPGDAFGALASALVGGTLGLIGGIVIGCLPGVRRAFTDYPALYYTPTAISVIGGSVIIFNIFL